MNEISESRDQIRGYLAVASATAGWPEQLAAVVARLAEPVVSARLVEGLSPEDAIGRTLGEADILMAVEVFAAALQGGASPMEAFERVAELKRVAMDDEPASEAAQLAARRTFETALSMGLSPHAAIVASNMLAGAAVSLERGKVH